MKRILALKTAVALFCGLMLVGCNPINGSIDIDPSQPIPATEISIPTETSSAEPDQFEVPTIVVSEGGWRSLYLQDLGSGKTLQIDMGERRLWQPYSWADDGCSFFVGPRWGMEGSLVRVNMDGVSMEELHEFDWSEVPGAIENVSIGPDDRYISYTVGTGEFTPSGYEQLDTYVVETDSPESYVKVSDSGASSESTWAPNNSLLAYADLDESGLLQVYAYDPTDKSKVQLTNLGESTQEIRDISWSPLGDSIVFILDSAEGESVVAVATLSEGNVEVFSDSSIDLIDTLWWQDEITVLGYLNPAGRGGDFANGGIYAIDVVEGTFDLLLGESETPDGYLEHPSPLSDTSTIGFFSPSGFYLYDILGNDILRLSEKFTDIREWIPSPVPSSKSTSCR